MRILAADIGGTNSRFALFETEPLRLTHMVHLSSAVPDFSALLDRLAEESPAMAPEKADRLSLAVAGPIEEAACEVGASQRGVVNSRGRCPVRAKLSNLPWVLDIKEARKHRPFGPVLLINDFEAQAWACLVPGVLEDALTIMAGEECPATQGSPRALIGAGTGLGMALLMPMAGQERIFPSEGGHMAFPFVDREERAFGDFVAARRGVSYARGDDVVTGPGLVLLHEFLTGRRDSADFTEEPGFSQSATCRMFARFYARAARTLALMCLPMGGLILTSGLAANKPVLVDNDDFRQEFLNAPAPHRGELARISVSLNINQLSGLWGAARAACEG